MTILVNDIKIYQSQDNTDNDSGGGSRTSAEIVDGNVNNLFPDISRIDTVSGDVALRKVFPTVFTANNDIYYGAHAMIRKKPTDPKVSALLFHTDDAHDKRIDARNAIESYLVASYEEQFYLFGNHVTGSRSVTFLQALTSSTPSIGEVYLLIDPSGFEQYIRIVDMDEKVILLSWNNGSSIVDFARRRIICEIEQPLGFSFAGSAFDPVGMQSGKAVTYATQIANAAQFYGTKKLAVDADISDIAITVESIYEALVPSSKAHEPLIDQSALGGGQGIIPSGNLISLLLSVPTGNWFGSLNCGITPGSLSFGDYIDDGETNIINTLTNLPVASINYVNGDIDNLIGGITISGNITFNFESGVGATSNLQFTTSILITSANQSFFLNKVVSPLPSSGQLYVDYRSQGKWYRIFQYGTEPTIGSFVINDNLDGTGTLLVTFGSLPDIDSTTIISWGSLEKLKNRTAETHPMYLKFELGDENINPLSFSLVAKGSTITSDANGVLSDTDGTIDGELDTHSGDLLINALQLSDRFDNSGSANDVVITYDYAAPGFGEPGEPLSAEIAEASFVTVNRTTGVYAFNIGDTVDVGLVSMNFPITYYSSVFVEGWTVTTPSYVTLKSDVTGVLTDQLNRVWGSVAANGDVSLTPSTITITGFGNLNIALISEADPRYKDIQAKPVMKANVIVNVKYKKGVPASYPLNKVITDKMENVCQYVITTDGYIGGEVAFKILTDNNQIANNFYSKDGVIFKRSDITTSLQVGDINYADGIINVQYLLDPNQFYLKFYALGTNEIGVEDEQSVKFTFKTAATKIITSSLQLRYNTADDPTVLRVATTDQNGVITGTNIDSGLSYVDAETGMVHLEFTNPAFPASFKYDAIAEKNLPVDPELLGLNPIRLPIDGRVPVFEYGRHLIIFDETTTAVVGGTPVADQVDTLARSGQAYIEVIDSAGKRLDPTEYVADRAAGTVTFGNPLTLQDKYAAALVAPFSIVDRIEDMVQAADVQINGDINLSAALTHNYTAANSYVASALVWGDTGSRAYNLFSQEIWDGGNPVWSDILIGDPTTAQYDVINYPIGIDNQSSASGRWAIIFTSSTTVNVAHEKLGIVQTGVSIAISDVSPINQATLTPYFTMYKDGFGGGWVTNNVIRLNTDSGDQNMWVIRTIQAGALSESTDNMELEIRGDAN